MDLSILSTLISENYAARADAPRCRSCQCKMRLSDSGERKLKTFEMAPEVGFEPTTNRLTADRSTTELLWNDDLPRKSGVTVCAHGVARQVIWLRGRDLNPRPSGYEPDELPGCSTPRLEVGIMAHRTGNATAKSRSTIYFRAENESNYRVGQKGKSRSKILVGTASWSDPGFVEH